MHGIRIWNRTCTNLLLMLNATQNLTSIREFNLIRNLHWDFVSISPISRSLNWNMDSHFVKEFSVFRDRSILHYEKENKSIQTSLSSKQQQQTRYTREKNGFYFVRLSAKHTHTHI